MKKGLMNTLKGLLGLLILVGFGGGIVYWEVYGREALIYKEVLTVVESVPKNTIITTEMLTTIKIEENRLVDGVVTDPQKLIGLESKNYIPKNAQLCLNYFDQSELVLNEGQYIFKLPTDWLKSYPNSLRRKDTAFIYAIIREDVDNPILIPGGLPEGKLFETVVAYVKDGTNKEVVNINPKADDRIDASSNPVSIELVVTQTQLETLKKYHNQGYDFIIMYQ